jgi:predicted methyltransferase
VKRLAASFIALSALALPAGTLAQAPSAAIKAAVAAADRPAADKERDASRKPAEMMAFAGVKPGMKVAELLPGRGYFTYVFSSVVGPTGHVYGVTFGDGAPVKAIAAMPGHGNVSFIPYSGTFELPDQVDLVWTSQNYHDVYNRDPAGAEKLDAAVLKALKPGGIYIVLDHAGLPGGDNATLHRIDPAAVKAQVVKAGFEFVGESKALANPADPKTVGVRDPAVAGKTEQFIYKFRKPAK